MHQRNYHYNSENKKTRYIQSLKDHPWKFRSLAPLMTSDGNNFYSTGSWVSSKLIAGKRFKRVFGIETLDLQYLTQAALFSPPKKKKKKIPHMVNL